jgi:outer membrane protein TolC
MMYPRFVLILIVFLLADLGPFSIATGAPSEPLTISEAIAEALRRNPEIEAARHQFDAAAAHSDLARSGLMPQLEAVETYSRTNNPMWAFGTKLNQENIQAQDFAPERLNDPDPIDNFNSALVLNWNLFDGGKSWIGWRQAQKMEEAVGQEMRRVEQQVIARTASTYIGAMLTTEHLNVVIQALETAQAHLKVVEDRFRGGLAVKSDLLRAQVRIADLEQQRLQAESQVLVAEAMLKSLMGREDDGSLTLVGTFSADPMTERLEEWIDRAMKRRPELVRLQIQEEIARQGVDRTQAGHWPQLAVQGKYELNSEDLRGSGNSYTVGAVASLNLFSGQRISADTAAAKAMLANVRSQKKGLALGIRVQTQKAYYQTQSAWKSIEVAARAADQAEEGLRIVANRYQNGLLPIISLLDAQVAYQHARTQHYKALHDYAVARIELALSAGAIDKDVK